MLASLDSVPKRRRDAIGDEAERVVALKEEKGDSPPST